MNYSICANTFFNLEIYIHQAANTATTIVLSNSLARWSCDELPFLIISIAIPYHNGAMIFLEKMLLQLRYREPVEAPINLLWQIHTPSFYSCHYNVAI